MQSDVDQMPYDMYIKMRIEGSSVARQVKGWPTDLAVPGSNHVSGGDRFNRKQGSIAHGLSFSSAILMIWQKYC